MAGSAGCWKCKVYGKINNHNKSIAPHRKLLSIIIRFYFGKYKYYFRYFLHVAYSHIKVSHFSHIAYMLLLDTQRLSV